MNHSRSRVTAKNAILMAAACVSWAVFATEVGARTWRCGNTYTDQPCNGGKAIDLEDRRDAMQKHEADSTTVEARDAAGRLERERIRLESVASRRQPALIGNAPVQTPPKRTSARAERKNRSRQNAEYFSAHDPVATAKNKAAKAAARSADRKP